MNNLLKKVIATLFALVLIATGVCFLSADGSNVLASEKTAVSDELEGVLSVKFQLGTDTSDTAKIRLVSTVDSLEYSRVGFQIIYKGKEINYDTGKVYSRIEAAADGVEYNFSPNVFDVQSKYFITATLINIKDFNEGIYVRPFWINDGVTEYGVSRYITVNDCLDIENDDVVNVSLKTTVDEATKTVNMTSTLDGTELTATKIYSDGTYTHFNVDVTDKTLPSVTTFTYTDAESVKTSTTYRQLVKAYSGSDTTWYNENAEELVIVTADDLYGFADIVNGKTTFNTGNIANQTFYLGGDITVNAGTPDNGTPDDATDDWATVAPQHSWTPIGYYNANNSPRRFTGKFDGQGHTISGIYCEASTVAQWGTGLFGATSTSSTIKNLRLENSYFVHADSKVGNPMIGSIVGVGAGTIQNVYSNAIIDTKGAYTGGLVGATRVQQAVLVEDCWFDGTINLNTVVSGIGGIVGRPDAGATIKHCLNSGDISGNNTSSTVGGILGIYASTATGTLSVYDTLNVGNIQTSATSKVGAIIGSVEKASTLTNVYTTGKVNTISIGNDSTKVYATTYGVVTADIKGYNAMVNTSLTFNDDSETADIANDGHWVSRNNATPAIKSLATESALYTPDTTFEQDKDGYNLISTPEQLYGAAKLINAGGEYVSANFRLTKDIQVNEGTASRWASDAPKYTWIPMGANSENSGNVRFAGKFDGAGFAIEGIYCEANSTAKQGTGLFGATATTSVIENLRLENSYLVHKSGSNPMIGSVVGVAAGTIKRVYSDAIVATAGSYAGGLVGASRQTGCSVTIEDSWFDGEVYINANSISNFGGILGRADAGAIIKHCLNSGNISSSYTATAVGGIFGANNSTVDVKVEDTLNTGYVKSAATTNVGSLIGQNLQSTLTLTNVFTLENNSAVSIGSDSKSGYATTYGIVSDVSSYNGYLNTNLSFLDDASTTDVANDGHWVVVKNGAPGLKCFTKGESLKGMEWYKETPHLLSNTDDLYGFATLAQYTDFAGKTIKLANDIIVNDATLDPDSDDWADVATTLKQWTPIGSNQGVKFAGTFDGDGHAISGLYYEIPNTNNLGAGLFGGTASGCVIQNLRLENSYFTQKTTQQVLVGGIVGYGQGTFKNIYSNVIIDTKGSYTSGFLGGNTGDVTIEDCWFDGELNVLVNGVESVGGFLGRTGTGSVSISHSLNSGLISSGNTSSGAMGGFIGYAVSGNKIELTDCLNVGTIYSEYSSTKRLATLIGSVYNETIENKITMTNTYAMAESYQVQANPGGYSSAYGANKKFIDYGKISKANLTGYAACTNTQLSFGATDGHWVIINGSTPMLKNMATSNALYTPDTSFEQDADGYYLIESAEELYGAAKLINEAGTYLSAKFRLTKDIVLNEGNASDWKSTAPKYTWLPMGSKSNPFAGQLNGNGYSINGIYCTNIQYSGLFGSTAAVCIVKDLKLQNSYFSYDNTGNAIMGSISGRGGGTFRNIFSDAILNTKGSYTGGLLGGANLNTDITDCWFNGNVTILDNAVRGAAGFVGRTDAGKVSISHSLNSGYVSNGKTSSAYIGGFVGYATNAGTSLEISDCLTVGGIHSTYKTGQKLATLIGYMDAGMVEKTTLTNTYAMAESYQVQNSSGYASVYGGSDDMDEYGKISEANITGYNAYLNTELTFIDDATTDVANDGHWVARMDGTPALKCFTDLENDETIIDTSWYTEATGTSYEIANASDLYGLAQIVVTDVDDFEGDTILLSDNITINEGDASSWEMKAPEYAWNPIGYYKNSIDSPMFRGVLNGQGNTISGLYCDITTTNNNHGVGLVGALGAGGRITNLKLANSYLHCTTTMSNIMLGSIAGYSAGNIDKVYSDAIMKSSDSMVGGLVGYNKEAIEISESCFAGNAETTGTQIGGIIGNVAGSATITSCWTSGTIYGKYAAGGACVGGVVGKASAGTLTIQHSHVSGKVYADTYHIGGLVGNIEGAVVATITDSMFSGDMKASYGREGDVFKHGQLVGTVVATIGKEPSLTLTNCYGVNDFAAYDVGASIPKQEVNEEKVVTATYTPTVTGRGYVSVKNDRLIGYIASDLYQGNSVPLDFTGGTWVLTKESAPKLSIFATSEEIYNPNQLEDVFALGTLGKSLQDAEDTGAGHYTVKITGKTFDEYSNYCAVLEEGIFDAYNNDQSERLNAEGVYNMIYTSADCGDASNDDWVVNVSYVDGTLTITITTTEQALSQHLKAESIPSYTTAGKEIDDGYTATTSQEIKFHMVEQKYSESASSYIIQLANGHFVIIDGGINTEAPYFMEYIESLVPEEGKKPIVEAWIISHAHLDHVGILSGLVTQKDQDGNQVYQDKIYLEGIYYNEANDKLFSDNVYEKKSQDGHHRWAHFINRIGSVFKTTNGDEPQIYRMYTGQQFTFDTVVMEVMLGLEQFTESDYKTSSRSNEANVFNETSTWIMFYMNDKKLLTAGDSNIIGKNLVKDVYSQSYLTVDVFTALHHGTNIRRDSLQVGFENKIKVSGAVLYSHPTDWYQEETKTTVRDRIKTFMQSQQNIGMTGFATEYESGSVSTNVKGYFYHGQGTVVLTFGDTITATVKAKNDWANDYGPLKANFVYEGDGCLMELTLSFKSSDISCTQTQLNYCLESKLPEDFDKDNAETQVLNNKTYYKYGKSQEIAVIEGTYSSSNNEIVITNTDNQQMRLQKTSDGNMEVTSIDPNFINVNVPVGTIFEVK